jgi:hypothetical protein
VSDYLSKVYAAYTDDRDTVLRVHDKGYYVGKGWRFGPDLAKAKRFTRAEAGNMSAQHFLKFGYGGDIITVTPDGRHASADASLNKPSYESVSARKLVEQAVPESAPEAPSYELHYVSGFVGNRSREFVKNVREPFMKRQIQALKALKGKWNGFAWVFPDPERFAQAKAVVQQFLDEWRAIEQKYPEGQRDIGAAVANDFFKHTKKSNNPNSQ